MNEYIYVWTEGENGPFKVHGDALSVYRASIMINSKHVQGQVLDVDGNPANREKFYEDCLQLIKRMP